ncbi:chitobiase/beta-hexosaminidase C-terminal domain-containing protein [Inhella proteolytica]|uniref:Chitobiase/beta-hexosaminidase C-terminal domain-containing protein n=1 Tax=Inhella proteolytica TaxID=2795029 RepID=A0A931J1Y1_9BURK|nr:chitobiase/beta-hexosaminidase C-terminal domain-containing protein [Inhella proteolytica]MBH9576193.1 chitobiase/beta-hexosaminidase C-terminal domain-containing protein [Inhella proteolytica]
MNGITWHAARWLFGLALACLSFFVPPGAQAQSLSTGVDFDGSQATLWFRSSGNLAWVDAHYSVNNGAQQNVRMTYNSAQSRFEVRFPAQAGQTVNHWFTYNNGTASYDSAPGSSQIGGGGGGSAPSFSPAAGSYASAQSVSISTSPLGLPVRYTTDGSTPTLSSALYAGPINVSANTTLKAVAVAPDGSLSAVGSAAYQIGSTGPAQGAEQMTGGVRLWFGAQANGQTVQWVDLHFNTGTGQQNVRMQLNSGAGRHEYAVLAAQGSTVNYSYTYYTSAAQDTGSYSVVVGPDGTQTQPPVFTPPAGSYSSAQTVSLSSPTPAAQIRYTLDGSTPTASSPLYTGPISVPLDRTLKAYAVAPEKTPSSVVSATYTSTPQGPSWGGVDASGGAVLWFKAGSTVDWVDLHVNPGTGMQNLRMNYSAANGRHEAFVAAAPGSTLTYNFTYYRPSVGAADTPNASYQLQGGCGTAIPPAVSFTPPGGSYSGAQTVTLASAGAGVQIRYTLDGSAPTSSSALYSAPISVGSNLTIRAIARDGCGNASPVASASYQIGGGGGGFAQGVSELGAAATMWFKPNAAAEYVILHYALGNASEIGPQMVFNAAVGRWEFTATPTAPGQVLNYWFTYKPLGGAQQDTQRYSLTLGGGLSGPLFSPAPGSYATAQQVSLANAAGVSGVIRYTTDGTAPTQQSPLYSGPISVEHASTIYAATFTADGQSKISMGNYVIGTDGGPVATPVFSHPTGSYGTRLRVNLLSATVGATLRYTLDGSTPTLNSLQYGAPIEVDSNLTLKAVAFKKGVASEVASASYTLTGTGSSDHLWNGKTTFNVVNATRGRWADDQVYWAIIGKDWATGKFVHVGANGELIPMALGDNGALMKNGLPYSNYFFRLSDKRSITIPAINSARILFSVGSPMYIWVNQDVNGNIAYAGANIENPTDPNTDVIFDFGEFAILPPGANPQGIFINTTRVDQFGFPLKLEVTGLDGFKQTVGESLTETREELFAKYFAETPAEFHSLGQPPYGPMRIMAPAHATFQGEGANATYLDSYVDEVWQQYANQDLVIDLKNGWAPFTGRVVNGKLRFTDAAGGQYFVNAKPSTSMVMLGNGKLDDPTGGTTDVGKQLQLQAQVCAALNRRVAHLPFADWWNGNKFFPATGRSNAFVKFWHDHSLNALSYGFAYDDVGGFSPSIHTRAPQTVTYTIGW